MSQGYIPQCGEHAPSMRPVCLASGGGYGRVMLARQPPQPPPFPTLDNKRMGEPTALPSLVVNILDLSIQNRERCDTHEYSRLPATAILVSVTPVITTHHTAEQGSPVTLSLAIFKVLELFQTCSSGVQ